MRILSSCLMPVLFLSHCLAAPPAITVGTASARSGQKATGNIHVPAGVDAEMNMPVIVINGAKAGPTLALVAGAHGTEYSSIIALEKLAQELDPEMVSGAVVILPLVNVGSFIEKVPHLNPVDRKNMNRFFPGNAGGTQTERASFNIAKEVVEKCDYLIDFHGGDLDENMRKYSYWARTGQDRLDATSHGMVLAFGFDHIVMQDFRTPPAAGAVTLTRYAAQAGKPSIAVEAGHAGTVNGEDVDALVRGSMNVMRHLEMLPGKVSPVEHPLWIARYSVLTSDRDGMFYPIAVPEAYVGKGMPVGYVTDYFGNKIWEAASPVSGVIIYICSVPSMKKGDTIAYVGEIAEAPPQ